MTNYPHQWTPGHVHEWARVHAREEEECKTCHRRRRTPVGELKHAVIELFIWYVDALETIRNKNAEIGMLKDFVDDEQQQRGEAVEDNAKLTWDVEEQSSEVKRLVKLMRSIRTSAWSAWAHWPGKDDSGDVKRIMEITSEFKDESTERNTKKEQEERV